MKKFALILLALAVVFPLVAEDVDIADAKVSISGDATTTFGIDLDTQATGFTNTLNAKMRLNFGLAGDMTSGGMDDGDIYGEVKIDEIEIRSKEANNENDTAATWEMDIDLEYAKIIGPTWWLSVKGADDAIDYENASQNGILGVAAAWDGQMDNVSNDNGSSGGFEAGFDLADAATIELSVFSLTDWTSVLGTADDNAYGIKAEAILTAVDNLTFKAAMNMGFGVADPTTLNDDMGFGALVGYEIVVNDDVSIKPEIGLDVHMLDTDGMDMAIGNGLIVTLAGDEITAAEDSIKDDGGTSKAWDDGVDSGLRVGWSYYMPDVGDAALGLQAQVGLSMIENLQIAAGFEAADIMDDAADMGMAVYGQYTMGDIKPFGGVFMLFDSETVLEAGLTYTDLLPHVDLLVQYNSGNLAAATADPGILTVGLKVDF